MTDELRRIRWRLILGADSQSCLGCGLSDQDAACDRALSFLYDREYSRDRNTRDADLSASNLSVPDWINQVHELFPKRTIERLERDAAPSRGPGPPARSCPAPPANEIQARGTVVEILQQGAFRVELANGHRCIARVSGEHRHKDIQLSPGDPVQLEFHPYDLSRGRIVLPD